MNCKAVLFDLIGTTVREKDSNTINNCFLKAFTDNNVSADIDLFKENGGKEKLEIIKMILNSTKQDLTLAPIVYNSFTTNVENSIENFSAADDAEEIFAYLTQRSIKIGLGTGLSRNLFEKILAQLKWIKNYLIT